MPPSASQGPLRSVGRYLLYREIAAGGMASVHLGRMRGAAGFSPIVAIKCLHPTYAKDPDFVRMFLDEARLAARIRHPNVVPVLDVVSTDDRELLLVMEYVHGESLSRLVRAGRSGAQAAPPRIASAVVCGLLHGLHAAHEAKSDDGKPLDIVHRDVSPQNVLVGADGIARVFDFGVAKAAGRLQATRDGQIKGKIAYMAPEQLRGGHVNRQADVYAAAVVLWEALTGRRLFRGDSDASVLEMVLFEPVDPPSKFADIPDALDAIVMRGLAHERSARFATARAMADALQDAAPPASPAQVGEWVQANAVDALGTRGSWIAELRASKVDLEELVPDVSAVRTTTEPRVRASAKSPATEEPAPSQVSSISVSKPGSSTARENRHGTAAFVLAMAAVAAAATFYVWPRRHPTAEVPAVPAASPAAPLAEPAPSSSTPSEATADTATSALVAGSVSAFVVAPPPRTKPSRAPAHAHPPAPAPAPGPTTASPPNCDPPYTRDAQGMITFKRECIHGTLGAP